MSDHFRDDPVANALTGLEVADTQCAGCGDFHLASLVRRAALPQKARVGDAETFAGALRHAFEPHAAVSGKAPVVIVAGSTDTWLYTSVLNAACAAGGPDFARAVTVNVVDMCRTPLTLIERYALSQDLLVETTQSDLGTHQPAAAADVVVMHGVLSFFPAGQVQEYLRHIAGWLARDGVLVCSHQHGRQKGRQELERRIEFTHASLDTLLKQAGRQRPGERDILRARIRSAFERRHSFSTAFEGSEEAGRFFEGAGLSVQQIEVLDRGTGPDGQTRRFGQRLIVTCCKGTASG